MSFLMKFFGLWWKGVGVHDLPDGGISVSADSNAWSKWLFILWRFQHKWIIFEVETDEPYWVFFADSHGQMMYKEIIKGRFAARLGNSRIRFIAVNDPLADDSLEIKISKSRYSYFEIRDLKKIGGDLTLI